MTGALSGFISGDNVTAVYSRTAGETVLGGPYTISAVLSPAGVLGNYDITYNTALLTITTRPITITADDQTKEFGDADPALTYQFNPALVSGDSFSGELVRTAGEGVGAYAITQGTLTAGSNYALTFVPGTFTIVDTTAPTGYVVINNNDTYTNARVVTLTLAAEDIVGVTGYRLANGTDASTGTEVAVSSTTAFLADINWELAEVDGIKTVAVQYRDAAGNWSLNYTDTIILDMTLPVVDSVIASPNPAPIETTVTITATLSDTNPMTSAEYRINGGDWEDMELGPDNLSATATVRSSTAVVYDIQVQCTDLAGNTSQGDAGTLLAIYDPSAGFVTGGGWIISPTGAYVADPSLTGKATFGFVSKYEKGKQVPTGNTQFIFHAGNFNFHSTSYEWLVISGARAQYKGSGTVNGVSGYSFLLTGIDGQINGGDGVDKFRIKVWNTATGATVYDNQMGQSDSGEASTALGGGSIVIHEVKTNGKK